MQASFKAKSVLVSSTSAKKLFFFVRNHGFSESYSKLSKAAFQFAQSCCLDVQNLVCK